MENLAEKIDYTLQAVSALAAIERLSDDLARTGDKQRMTREKWRDYGAALLAQRLQIPSTQQFNEWIINNGLDKGRAADRRVRTDAMWLAEKWGYVVNHVIANYHNPYDIRQACRAAGYEWAGETDHHKERKANSERSKRKARRAPGVAPKAGRIGWAHAVLTAGPLPWSYQTLWNIKQRIEVAYGQPIPRYLDAGSDQVRAIYQAALAVHAKAHKPQADVQAPVEVVQAPIAARQDLSQTAQQKFDAALARARQELETQFAVRLAEQVRAEVERRLPEHARKEIADAMQSAANARMLEGVWRHRAQSCKEGVKLFMAEWRAIAACLHPDRAPEDRRRQFDNATNAFLRIKNALGGTDYERW